MKKCQFCAEDIQDAAIVCKHCGRDFSSTATRPPSRGPRPPEQKEKIKPLRLGSLVILAILILLIAAATQFSVPGVYLGTPPSTVKNVYGPISRPDGDEAQALVDRFGTPDTDSTSGQDKTRPSTATRMLTYSPERVRAIYRAAAPPGKWTLIGYADPVSNSTLVSDTAFERLAGRKRQVLPAEAASPTRQPTTESSSAIRLAAAASASASQLRVQNLGAVDWTDVKLQINSGLFGSGYTLRVRRIAAAHEFSAGLMHFTDSDGNRFNPFQKKVQKLVVSVVVGGKSGIRVFDF